MGISNYEDIVVKKGIIWTCHTFYPYILWNMLFSLRKSVTLEQFETKIIKILIQISEQFENKN